MANIMPMLYTTGFASVLASITCSHILIISQNVFYSHDSPSSDPVPISNQTYTIFRINEKNLNQSGIRRGRLMSKEEQFRNNTFVDFQFRVRATNKVFEWKTYIRQVCVYSIIITSSPTVVQKIKTKWHIYDPIANMFVALNLLANFGFAQPVLYFEVVISYKKYPIRKKLHIDNGDFIVKSNLAFVWRCFLDSETAVLK